LKGRQEVKPTESQAWLLSSSDVVSWDGGERQSQLAGVEVGGMLNVEVDSRIEAASHMCGRVQKIGFRKWISFPKMERVNITGGGTLYFRIIACNFCVN
jgi:hypothetical protein